MIDTYFSLSPIACSCIKLKMEQNSVKSREETSELFLSRYKLFTAKQRLNEIHADYSLRVKEYARKASLETMSPEVIKGYVCLAGLNNRKWVLEVIVPQLAKLQNADITIADITKIVELEEYVESFKVGLGGGRPRYF